MTERLVVVGADAAGMSAASQAKRMRPDLEVIAFERSAYASYSACGEPYYVAGRVDPLERLVARAPESFAAQGIDLRRRHEVREIDLDRRRVTAIDLEREEKVEVAWDQLMLATGAMPLRPRSIDGIDLPGVMALRTLEDAASLRAVAEPGAGRVVIVGAGYIGLEVAEALVGRGARVTIVTMGPTVLERTLDPRMGELVDQAVREGDIELHTATTVDRIIGGERAEGVGCGEETFPADLVFLGMGTAPDVSLAVDTGMPLGVTGAIAVDSRQRTGIEGVWAAGDCAETTHRVTGRPANIHLGTVANKTGRIAGINIGGGDAEFPGVLGTAIVSVFGTEVARTGLSPTEAEAAGMEPVVGMVRGYNSAAYWPGAESLTVMAVADGATGRLVGAQIVGAGGSGKKIDVFATAIWNSVTADELAWVDLAYAPPFSGVWDVVHVAARRAGRA